MIKGKLIFKTEYHAGKVCKLLNEIRHAENEKRDIYFHIDKKRLYYEINTQIEQKELEKRIKLLRKRKTVRRKW